MEIGADTSAYCGSGWGNSAGMTLTELIMVAVDDLTLELPKE